MIVPARRASRRHTGVRAAVLALALVTSLCAGPYCAAATIQATLTFTHGVACGDPSFTEVVMWTRTDSAAVLIPEILDPRTRAPVRALPAVGTGPESDFTIKVIAGGEAAGDTVPYRFRGPAGELSPVGACRTASAPTTPRPVTLGFSGDTDWKWRRYPLLTVLNREPLDFFIFLGDVIYETTNLDGTTSAQDLDGYRAKYRENREPRAATIAGEETPLQTLYQRFGMYSLFDNHETGTSAPYTEGGAPAGDGVHTFVNQTDGFEDRVRAFTEYQPVRDRRVAGTDDPRMDGTRGFDLSQQWGADLDGIKSWAGGYRVERDRLLQVIDANGIDNVVFLTADNHYTMINNLGYHAVPEDPASPLVPARNAFEILTGPIGADTRIPPVKADLAGLSGRAADRRVTETLAGDVPNTDGVVRGQKQAGLDPVGLEADFPGLVPDSVTPAGADQYLTQTPNTILRFQIRAAAPAAPGGPR